MGGLQAHEEGREAVILSLAPMEGVTGHVFRRVHAECFGKMDRYYTPFLTPPRVGSPSFGKRDRKEVDAAFNQGLNVIPQVLTKRADEFLWAAGLLRDLGFTEVNLNLGCPSGTVASKGKGSGFLGHPDELRAFLAEICDRSPLPVSVKTRVGVESDDDFEQILGLYREFPLVELIVHPRVQADLYRGVPRQALYGQALETCPFPVAYNGDIATASGFGALVAAYPATRHVMLGRGVVADPALPRQIRGGAPATAAELHRFHDALFEAYEAEMGGNAVFRMKEWWFYAKARFEDPQAAARAVRKVRRAQDYRAAVDNLFATQPLAR